MDDMLMRIVENLANRVTGPMKFRLLLQPLTALIVGIKAGAADARAGRPPFLWSALTDPAQRRAMLREGWKDIARVFVFAVVIDAIYQAIELQWFYPGEGLLVATILAVVPYVLIRGPVNRFIKPSKT